jgi:acetoin utilization protein AcuB
MPVIGAVMTPFPYFVQIDDSIAKVQQLMVEHSIRHIPVQHEGSVVGVISDRDLRALPGDTLSPTAQHETRVRDVLAPNPYIVDFNTPLAEVVRKMAARQIGSAIVLRRGRLAGILSSTDVCRILASILEARYPEGDGNSAA